MTDYSGNPFKPALNYIMDFDPGKKAAEHTMSVAYGKVIEIEGKDPIRKVLERKETIQKFQGISVEELLYTIDEFKTRTEDILMSNTQRWTEWPKILSHGPRKEWNTVMDEHTYSKTGKGLKNAIREFSKLYARDPRARNTMIKNLTKQFRMPVDTDIHAHWCRLDLLMDYTDLLPTTTVIPKIFTRR